MFTSGGHLSTWHLSTEEQEITWDVSSCLTRNRGGPIKDFKSSLFYFAGATWYLFVKFQPSQMSFGIDTQRSISSNELFDCSCKIIFEKFSYEVSKSFELKFKYGKDMLVCAEDFFRNRSSDYASSYLMQGFPKIVCRVKAKKLTDITSSSGSSAAKAPNQRSLTKKDVEKPMVDLDCNVCQDYKNMLDSGEDSDVSIQIGDQLFKAHRSILAARSSVFAAMLRHHMKEKTTGVVNVMDCDASSFQVFLEFLYCGSTEKLSVENVFSLYNTADKYDRQDLKLRCLQFMEINLSVENFCETIHLSLQHSETDLFNLSVDFFARKMKTIIKTSKWKAFILENPIQGNEILIKALESGRLSGFSDDDY